jgi:hypothetical protein
MLVFILERCAPSVNTLPEAVASVYTVTERWGVCWFTVWMVYKILLWSITASGFGDLLRSVIGRCMMLSFALVSIRQCSALVADAVHAIEKNPYASATSMLGLIAVYTVFSIDRLYAAARSTASDITAAVSNNIRRPRQAKDVRRTAVHEVGHLLLYAALPTIPEKLKVKVFHKISRTDQLRGYVQADKKCGAAETERLTHWQMLSYLGGTVAEQLVYGNRADGAVDDNVGWTHSAQQYLACGYGEVYFLEPMNMGQIEHNHIVINRLKAQHQAALTQFLAVNRALLDELTERLVTEREMSAKMLAPFFKRVVFTDAVQPMQPHDI